MSTLTQQIEIPKFEDIKEPQVVTLVATARAGTKVLQSYLDEHPNILMIPAYPLLYFYPHWDTWSEEEGPDFSWERAIELFCEKHASVLDSREIPGLSGLERLGPGMNEHIQIDAEVFRTSLKSMLEGQPVTRRTFLLAVHYSYGIAKGWDLKSKSVLLYHSHDPHFLEALWADFPDLKVLNMARNPRASLHSTTRQGRITDDAKLNVTDSMLYASRNWRLACYYQLATLDGLGSYLDSGQVTSFKLESLYQDLEQGMRRVADWLDVEFSEGMLQSTFDGKLWWGDKATQRPVNGLDPNSVSDGWTKSISRIDNFVFEGIAFDYFERYGYERVSFLSDSLFNRVLLALAILVPNKAEWNTLKYYLNPKVHLRFLAAAIAEATGRTTRKDYTWNATYLYKWTYVDLKLWNARWHQRFLNFSERKKLDGESRTAPVLLAGAQALYVANQYVKFCTATVTLPLEIFGRWRICYTSFWRRRCGRSFLPKLLE